MSKPLPLSEDRLTDIQKLLARFNAMDIQPDGDGLYVGSVEIRSEYGDELIGYLEMVDGEWWGFRGA